MLMHAIIQGYKSIQNKNNSKIKMNSIKNKLQFSSITTRRSLSVLAVAGLFAISAISAPFVYADRYQEKIDRLDAENSQKAQAQDQLGAEASSLAEKIKKLQAEITALQNRINDNETKMAELKRQIAAAEAELVRQRDLLGQTIRAMYLEGEITTVEMLATSKDLSAFFDKQQHRESVNSKIKTTLDKITELKLSLNSQKETVEKLLAEQKDLQGRLAAQRAENSRLLSLNQSEQNKLESEIKANKSRMASLRAEQLAANRRAISSGQVSMVSSGTCGGGYPNSTPGPWGSNWGCNHPLDNTIDNWGMYNRECVSYTAFRVANSGRHMPYWGGRGNAHMWDDNARSAGIPVDGNPRVGDVAVAEAGYPYGGVGHVMYVEKVYSGNKILVSQYNFGSPGEYSTMVVGTSGLDFIHF